MTIKFPQIPGRQAKGRAPCNLRQQRNETERRRREEFARQNASIALKLKGTY